MSSKKVKQKKKRELYILLFLLCLLAGIFLLSKRPSAKNFSFSTSPYALPLASLTPFQVPPLDYANPKIKNITIKTTVDLARNYENPPFTLLTGGGHYLFQENGFNLDGRITLSYDGRELYSGSYLNVYNNVTTLSPNGEHFGYVIENEGNTEDIYVDGVKVGSTTGVIHEFVVTDTADYYYTLTKYVMEDPESTHRLSLYKNQKKILSYPRNSFGEVLTVSPDGKHYVLWMRDYKNGERIDHFLFDGKETKVDKEIRDVYFSKNWHHYAEIIGKGGENDITKLVIDGTVIKEVTGPLRFGELLDTGAFSYYLTSPVIDNIRTEFPVIEDKTFPFTTTKALMTEDGNHVLTQNRANKWEFDGKALAISPAEKYDKVEIVGNTIYVYHITN